MGEPVTHRVLPYDGIDAYLAGVVPFLRTGVEAGDRVMAVTPPGSRSLLREALGDAVENEIEFVEPAVWYDHPSRRLADCLGDAEEAASEGRRLRLLAEPAWTDRPKLETLEWQRAEALVNVAFGGTGAAILCAYSQTLPAGVTAVARQTHPETLRGTSATATPGYVDPWTFSERCDRAPLPDPPPHAEPLPLDQPDLFWLRRCVSDYARRAGLWNEHLQRLLVAITEVVTNATRHGEPPLRLTMWAEPTDGALVCQVTGHGRWTPCGDPGFLPPRTPQSADGDGDAPGRFGLWAVRLLCSSVHIRIGDQATTVRLRLRPPAALRPSRVDPR